MLTNLQVMELTKEIVLTAIANGHPKVTASYSADEQNKQYREELDKLINSVYEAVKGVNSREG